DFEGQKLVESLSTLLFIFVGIISFTIGFVLQDIIRTLYIGLGGSALVFLLTIPPWPFYKRHPITWLPVRAFDNQVNSSSIGKVITT
ncbi:Signal peptidase complex subunit 1, partial [Erysiphe neolycopersici]